MPPGPTRVRPTHFISLPLGSHSPSLRLHARRLTDTLASCDPPPAGFDSSIVIPEVRLHLTLAVFALRHRPPRPASAEGGGAPSGTQILEAVQPPNEAAQPSDSAETFSPIVGGEQPRLRTRYDASALLQSCRPELARILNGRPLRVRLSELGTFSSHKDKSHVVFARPSDVPETPGLLMEVAEYVHQRFKAAGYLSDHRPLQLHCTLLNTSKRRPSPPEPHACPGEGHDKRKRRKPDRGRQPFDARALFNLPPEEQDLGTVEIEQLQLCAMSTFDESGAYRCLDAIGFSKLHPPGESGVLGVAEDALHSGSS